MLVNSINTTSQQKDRGNELHASMFVWSESIPGWFELPRAEVPCDGEMRLSGSVNTQFLQALVASQMCPHAFAQGYDRFLLHGIEVDGLLIREMLDAVEVQTERGMTHDPLRNALAEITLILIRQIGIEQGNVRSGMITSEGSDRFRDTLLEPGHLPYQLLRRADHKEIAEDLYSRAEQSSLRSPTFFVRDRPSARHTSKVRQPLT